jgi:hypothetical protein
MLLTMKNILSLAFEGLAFIIIMVAFWLALVTL